MDPTQHYTSPPLWPFPPSPNTSSLSYQVELLASLASHTLVENHIDSLTVHMIQVCIGTITTCIGTRLAICPEQGSSQMRTAFLHNIGIDLIIILWVAALHRMGYTLPCSLAQPDSTFLCCCIDRWWAHICIRPADCHAVWPKPQRMCLHGQNYTRSH